MADYSDINSIIYLQPLHILIGRLRLRLLEELLLRLSRQVGSILRWGTKRGIFCSGVSSTSVDDVISVQSVSIERFDIY